MNILHVGNKSPVQRGFFTNSVDNLLPALGFLGGLYNFWNFVIIFYLMQVMVICRSSDFFYRFGNDRIPPKTCRWNRSLRKLKTTLKNHFLWFTLGRVTVMRILVRCHFIMFRMYIIRTSWKYNLQKRKCIKR